MSQIALCRFCAIAFTNFRAAHMLELMGMPVRHASFFCRPRHSTPVGVVVVMITRSAVGHSSFFSRLMAGVRWVQRRLAVFSSLSVSSRPCLTRLKQEFLRVFTQPVLQDCLRLGADRKNFDLGMTVVRVLPGAFV